MGSALTIAILAAGYAALFALERAAPLRRARAPLVSRLVVNVAVSAAAFAAAAVAVSPAASAALDFTRGASFGLLQLAGLRGPADIVATFVLLDLSFYYWHRANHASRFLWRFHNVHHIDPDLDVSTAFRFHFAEVGFSALFRAAQVLVIGPSLAAWIVYEIAFELGTLFHHSNLRLPIALERALNKVLVTPRMHGIHHSDIREEDLSNFGVVLPWWDRLHGTLRLNVPQQDVRIGIPGYALASDNRIAACLAMPFRAQRDYWAKQLVRMPAPTGRRQRLRD